MKEGEHIVLNTEGHRVMYLSTSKLSLVSETLSLEDLETLPDQNNDAYSPTCLFWNENREYEDREYLTIMSYSET